MKVAEKSNGNVQSTTERRAEAILIPSVNGKGTNEIIKAEEKNEAEKNVAVKKNEVIEQNEETEKPKEFFKPILNL